MILCLYSFRYWSRF